jgi:predicted metal-dependent hydrolase
MNIKKTINLAGQSVEYTLRESARVRYLRLSMTMDYGLVVTRPRRIPEFFVERFLREKTNWILKYITKVAKVSKRERIKITFHEFTTNKLKAIKVFKESIEFFNRLYRFPYKKITVRNQSTIWGSCSRDGNLQFNYKLLQLPTRMRDYVVVHELCHVKEHNHSERFWKLVAQTIPDYKQLRRSMRNYIL